MYPCTHCFHRCRLDSFYLDNISVIHWKTALTFQGDKHLDTLHISWNFQCHSSTRYKILVAINQSTNRWIDQSINQSINQSIDRSLDRSVGQPASQSVSQTNQPTNQQTNERAIGDCVLAKIYWSVCETEAWISDSQFNLLHFELLIASLAQILTELL